ncbi:unnamed protein product [Dibothriocephalus latus]|uniref:Uncharacterized protein n=1 Tax=Dibothriocephalus latus TaxID=60516 RepID=A0A3P7SCP4_DIBLA|nr:unnamed protein product [Dibothriocephalus latus]
MEFLLEKTVNLSMVRLGGIDVKKEITSNDNVASSASTSKCRMRVTNHVADFTILGKEAQPLVKQL